MLKSPSWGDKLTVALCWKFFKYKLVLDTTRGKLLRDRKFLPSQSINILGEASTCEHRERCGINTITHRMDKLEEDIESLLSPLNEITQMIRRLQSPLLIITLTV